MKLEKNQDAKGNMVKSEEKITHWLTSGSLSVTASEAIRIGAARDLVNWAWSTIHLDATSGLCTLIQSIQESDFAAVDVAVAAYLATPQARQNRCAARIAGTGIAPLRADVSGIIEIPHRAAIIGRWQKSFAVAIYTHGWNRFLRPVSRSTDSRLAATAPTGCYENRERDQCRGEGTVVGQGGARVFA